MVRGRGEEEREGEGEGEVEVERRRGIVVGEVSRVVASMRLNSRWSARTRPLNSHYPESTLLKGFKDLRLQLNAQRDISKGDPLTYLKPFLNVIRSEETSGPITGVALSSVDKFLKEFIRDKTPNASKALEAIAESVTHCRFEATDPESDEVVLMKILHVLLSCIKSQIGYLLPEEIILEMIQTCFRMSNQLRLSELLRKTAEYTLTEMMHTIFSCVDDIPTESLVTKGKTYQPECLQKILQFIFSIMNPSASGSTELERLDDDICLLGLNLINTILEISGTALVKSSPAFLKVFQDDLCKSLLKCSQSDNLMIFTQSLTAFFNLFKCMKQHLKPQLELFFTNITRLMESKSISYEQQEIVLELILDLCKDPFFMVELYVNYDCDSQCANVFDNLCKFLYKNSFPVSGSLYTTHVLSLEGLLSIVHSIVNRLSNTVKDNYSAQELRSKKQQKTLMLTGVEHFNRDPAEGIAFLQSCNLLPQALDAKSVATFLKTGYGLNKALIGEYLGKKKDFNTTVLEAYIDTFQFQNDTRYIDSIRSFLESFRIPGEAPVIARILEAFAKAYFASVKEPFANADAAYILAYSVVMLNVDQHNPQVTHRMTEQEFIKNNRGINDKKDLPQEMLKDIYYSIKNNEMKIPEEQLSVDVQNSWRHVLNRSKILGEFQTCNTGAYDKDLFAVIWGPLIAAISVVYDTADDDSILSKATEGFNVCAKISAHYELTDVLDNLMISLCKFSSLLSLSGGSGVVLHFGRSKKAQLATKTVFAIAKSNYDYIREGWKNVTIQFLFTDIGQICNCIITLQKVGLLPPINDRIELLSLDTQETLSTASTPPLQTRATSILSTFGLLGSGSWFGVSNPSPPEEDEISRQDAHAEENAKQCVKECSIKELLTDASRVMATESLLYVVKAIASISSRPQKATIPFDEKMAMFCVDLLTTLALLNEHRLSFVWPLISDHFISIIATATSFSPLTERVLVDLFSLCVSLVTKEDAAAALLQTLRQLLKLDLSLNFVELFVKKVILGMSKLLEKNKSLLSTSAGVDTLLLCFDIASKYSSSEVVAMKLLADSLSTDQNLSTSNFALWVQCATFFTRPKCKPETSMQAMELLFSLHGKVSSLVNLTQEKDLQAFYAELSSNPNIDTSAEQEAWELYWLPILKLFCVMCKDPRLEIRNYAMTFLQKALLSHHLNVLSSVGWYRCFEQIVFPLMKELLSPLSGNPTKADIAALEETRLRASALLSKIFLQYLPKIIKLPDFSKLWQEILLFMELYMKVEDSELLSEAVRESLKNILLVMSASGIFKPGTVTTLSGEDIWSFSWAMIDNFCPSLKAEFELIYK